jgi:RNA polymerase sigma factor (sigma-70 family)
MATRHANPVLRHIRELAGEGILARLTDRQLLERFTEHADHAAFEALVRRHGPMVLRVCRSVLRDEHAADDAFQATFLVLARKAASLLRQELLAAWLYGVAHRVAARARVEAAKRLNREARAAVRTASDPSAELSTREVCAALDEELGRLPERYRTPFYLCHVEGRTRDQAARQLGCSLRTLQRLLERGRGLLQARLSRRGVSLSTALLAVTLTHGQAPAALPSALLEATLTAARAAASGAAVPVQVAALARGVLRRMAAARGKLLAVLALVAATAGAALVVPPGAAPEGPERAAKPPEARTMQPQPATDLHGDPLPPGARLRLGSLRLRNGAPVFAVLFTPDGKGLLSGSATRSAHLWEVATGREIHRFDVPQTPGAPHPNLISALALSRDGRTLAVGTRDGTICLWDTASARLVRALKGPPHPVPAVAFAPDGTLLASAVSPPEGKSPIILWDLATGKELRRLADHPKGVSSLAFAPRGKLLASADGLGGVQLWDAASGRQLKAVDAHKRFDGVVAFSPDGIFFALTGHDSMVRIWEAASKKRVHRLNSEAAIFLRPAAFSPDGRLLAAGGLPGLVFLWDTATGERVGTVRAEVDEVRSLAFAPRGKGLLLATGNDNGTVRLFQLPDSATLRRRKGAEAVVPAKSPLPPLGHQSAVYAVAVSPDGKAIATGSQDRTVRFWDAASGKELRRLEGNVPDGHIDWVCDLCYSRDGKLLASADHNGRLFVRAAATGKILHKLRGRCAAFSPDGKLLATASPDHQTPVIQLWDLATGQELRRLHGHKAMVFRLAFSPDGKTLASGGMGVLLGLKAGNEEFEVNTLRLWDVTTGKLRFQFGDPRAYVYTLAFTPDGKTLISAGDSHGEKEPAIRLWETATGKERGHLAGHRDRDWSLSLSLEGRILASGSSDGTARLWDLRTRKEIRTLEGHRGWVTAVAFGPGGRTLVTGSWDTTALVWDVADLVGRRR